MIRIYIMLLVASLYADQLSELTEAESERLQREIEEMREDAEKQQAEGLSSINKALLEAVLSGSAFATGQELIGLWGAYNAKNDLVDGCHEYSEGARYNERIDQLERDFLGETENDKKAWWQFWK